jgi:hypothetical protein
MNPHQVWMCDAGCKEHLSSSTDAIAMAAAAVGLASCVVVVDDLHCHRGSLPAACKATSPQRTHH